ncbi:helix-turn-helix domain-containing protein [Geomonas propionica]|uniref:Helix-turn-helix transcriptional regulator n=1 Tax=Geomonas propionica TaxID=2798582 RepID=A0ABS0YVX0_9BACT|nr:helix-turn-helix transcriptional regulator [Geomonas propionica]MBJ6802071.1 helix-turn-helix transcriptional regulator [Geomonas propionica]
MSKVLTDIQIGQKIREFRLQAGVTQEKLAEELGITFQQIQKYERGVTKVNLVKLQQLAETLKIPISAFFQDGSHTAFQLNDIEKQVLAAFRKIRSETHKNSVLDIVLGLARDLSSQ